MTAYLPLAKRICAGYVRAWPIYRDEIWSAALLALCLAVREHDPEHATLPTWITRRIHWGIKEELRQRTRSVARQAGETARRPNGHYWEPPPACETTDWIESLGKLLPARERAAFLAVHRDGMSRRETAAMLGIKQTYAYVLISCAYARLRRRLASEQTG